jgi:hypothetical protein
VRCIALARLCGTKQDPQTQQQHTKVGVSAVGGRLLFEGADDFSRDVQEEYGTNEGQCQDEDNEGVTIGRRNPVTESMMDQTGIARSRTPQNWFGYSEDDGRTHIRNPGESSV